MKYLKYILRNATRNKLRSLLTVLSVCFSLAMMTVLYGFLAMQDIWASEATKHHRIAILNIQGFAALLPIAYVDRVRNMPEVAAAVPYSWYGGIYKGEQITFAQFGTDAKYAFDVWSEFDIDPEQLRAWREDRQGCVVDRRTAERRGWKIGEHIPLKGNIYSYDLDLTLRGVYDSPQPTDSLWFHWSYLDEGLRQTKGSGVGNAGLIFARAESAAAVPRLCKAIDDRFASSDHPTRSQTESAFAQMFTQMFGNVQGYIQNIGIAVIFSLSLVAANAMAMSMRERTAEIAVLKAIGFQRSAVLVMILGESCLIAMLGGLLGLFVGCAMLQLMHNSMPQFFPVPLENVAGLWLGYGLVVAALIGLVSGLVPAIRAAQMSVIDGLRRVV